MKKTKIILLATVGICIFCFLPSVLGTANVRPITDFTDTNSIPGLPPLAAWVSGEDNLIMVPHGFFETLADCNCEGSVLERDLKDGRILYQVNLHVKGATTWVFWAGGNFPLDPPVFIGEMDYYFSAILIAYEGNLGDPVPTLWMIWFPEIFGIDPIGEYGMTHLTGSGTGTFTAFAEVVGLGSEGETANVKIDQIGLPRPEDHPQIDPLIDPDSMWPVEHILLY
ncbi:MAG: hypothetical protein JSV62_15940 [Promethearchaeota archaeon]|nr:MAG: hypothetical protein JSV62_15940 [Candidatus Lokiarchaeota archaeon]